MTKTKKKKRTVSEKAIKWVKDNSCELDIECVPDNLQFKNSEDRHVFWAALRGYLQGWKAAKRTKGRK